MSKSRGFLVIRGTQLIAVLALTALVAHAQGVIPGRYIVTFDAEVIDRAAAGQQLSQAHGFQIRNAYRYALHGMLIEVSPAAGPALVNALTRNPQVRSVVPDRQVTLMAQTDPKGVRRVAAEAGISIRANAATGIDVAVMDSGIDSAHQDLVVDANRSAVCIGGTPCVGASNPVQDVVGHGTSVAGAIAALDNNVDLVGVAPGANLISVQVFNSSGQSSDGDIIAGIDHLITLNQSNLVEVVNMSFREICTNSSGAATLCAGHPDFQPLETALQNLTNSGTTIVAASGNDAIDTKFVMPASSSAVIAVSAMADSNGLPGGGGSNVCLTRIGNFCLQSVPDDSYAPFSNFGSVVDVIAPGVDELLLARGGGTRRANGTSFAAPHAAGVAAIFIRDRLNRSEPTPLPSTVRQALIETGECYESGAGSGALFHGTTGCPSAWPADSDGFREPLVRADNIANFGPPAAVHDVSVTSVQTPAPPVLTGTTRVVVVNVANQGTQSETFNVSLTDNLSASISGVQSTTLGASASTSLNFDWTPTVSGTHLLTGTATVVAGEIDTADNSASAQVTVQAPSTATTTHIGDLDRASTSSAKTTWTATVTVTVHDNNHGPVSNATVQGAWSDGTTTSASCPTGQCIFSKSGLAKRTSSVTFSVTSVSHVSLAYASASNHDPDGDSNGTSIVVSKP